MLSERTNETPQVLSSLLSICLSRNRLTPSLVAVQLCAHLTWAVQPYPKTIKESDKDYLKFSQLPGIALDEVEKFKDVHGFDGFVQSLENSNDSCAEDVKRTVQNGVMPRSSAARSVVGERSVAPLSLIKLIVELRIPRERIVTLAGGGEKREQEFLMKKKDAEDISLHKTGNAFAHALHWPQTKKPSRWSSWATSRRKGCGATIQGFGLPDVRDAVPGSTKRWVVHTEGVSGQRYLGIEDVSALG